MIPPGRTAFAQIAAVALALLGALACRGAGTTTMDAGIEDATIDVPATPDGGSKPLALEFSATGCATFEPAGPSCVGTAPLTLTFTPIASAALTRFLWTFGDKTASSSERSPQHTYTLPGTYQVTVTAGGSAEVGSVQQTHVDYVTVVAASAGAACDITQQCADGRKCWCGSAAPCAPVLTRGLCGQRCDADAGGHTVCPDHTVCADLAAAPGMPSTSTADAWRQTMCLPGCATDDDCAAGFRCRDLLYAAPAKGWVRACFAAFPLGIGERCGDAAGKPAHADCASRTCADLGAFRRCSADCGTIGCPPGTACAHFGDGRNLCLAACGGGVACDDDPLLSCEIPGAKGPLGFAVANDPMTQAATYCAPKRCTTSADCGPAGTCPTGGGNCARIN